MVTPARRRRPLTRWCSRTLRLAPTRARHCDAGKNPECLDKSKSQRRLERWVLAEYATARMGNLDPNRSYELPESRHRDQGKRTQEIIDPIEEVHPGLHKIDTWCVSYGGHEP